MSTATDNLARTLLIYPKNLGEMIRQRREELGLSQEFVAEKAGITQSSVADIESGKTKNPRKPTLKALSEVLTSDFHLGWLKSELKTPPTSLEEKMREIIREIVREEMKNMNPQPEFIQDLGAIDEFDLKEAVENYKTLETTLEAWYKFEGKDMPEGFGLNFAGWANLSIKDKIATVRDVKNFADKMNEKIDSGELDDE